MDNKKAIIVSLHNDNLELSHLAESLDYKIARVFIQHQKNPGRPFYVGKGKIEEIKDFVEKNGVGCIIVNGSLTPSQWYNMERETGVKVYDRIRLILDIFADRAKRKEGRLQVKLAYLRYEKPYVRELIHRTKMGEHPGFMAGGEYQVSNYYEMIKKQIKKIRNDLKKLERERESLNSYREKKGFYLVTIAGYTNAGKSSLLNQMTGEHVKVEGKLFSTLSTTTRMVRQNSGKKAPILLTDTVGFIKELPHWLIDSFHSTLREIELSDMVILLLDINDDVENLKEKAELSIKEITNINSYQKIIFGLNKADLLVESKRKRKLEELKEIIGERPYVFLSAKTGENVENLIERIYDCIPNNVTMEARFPHTIKRQDISKIFKGDDVKPLYIDCNPDGTVRIICNDKVKEKIAGKFMKKGAKVEVVPGGLNGER